MNYFPKYIDIYTFKTMKFLILSRSIAHEFVWVLELLSDVLAQLYQGRTETRPRRKPHRLHEAGTCTSWVLQRKKAKTKTP